MLCTRVISKISELQLITCLMSASCNARHVCMKTFSFVRLSTQTVLQSTLKFEHALVLLRGYVLYTCLLFRDRPPGGGRGSVCVRVCVRE